MSVHPHTQAPTYPHTHTLTHPQTHTPTPLHIPMYAVSPRGHHAGSRPAAESRRKARQGVTGAAPRGVCACAHTRACVGASGHLLGAHAHAHSHSHSHLQTRACALHTQAFSIDAIDGVELARVQPRDQNETQGYLSIYYVVAREFIINNSFTEEPSNSFIVGHPVEGYVGGLDANTEYRPWAMDQGGCCMEMHTLRLSCERRRPEEPELDTRHVKRDIT